MANGLAGLLNQETLSGPPSPAESPSPIQGTGGGLADLTPAVVDGQAPAALSEGEFVWPADVVSMLGDGSTEAGSRILNQLMNEIRTAKQGGNDKQAKTLGDILK